MVPMAFGAAIWYTRSKLSASKTSEKKVNIAKAFPWFLFGYFVMAILGTKGFFTTEGIGWFKSVGAFLILMGLGGIGMNTRLDSFKGIGVKPFIVGLIGSIIVAMVSILLIWSLALYIAPAA